MLWHGYGFYRDSLQNCIKMQVQGMKGRAWKQDSRFVSARKRAGGLSPVHFQRKKITCDLFTFRGNWKLERPLGPNRTEKKAEQQSKLANVCELWMVGFRCTDFFLKADGLKEQSSLLSKHEITLTKWSLFWEIRIWSVWCQCLAQSM